MYTSEITIRVRYGETDQMGCVYYGNYALYFEQARVEAIRQLGVVYKDLESIGIHIPVTEFRTRFIRPARYDDLITVITTVKTLDTQQICFFSSLFDQRGKLLNEGEVTLVFYDVTRRKRIDMPGIMYEKLKPHFVTSETPV